MSALLFCSYTIISTLSHSFLLDLPEIAMIAAAIMALLWWRNTNEPNYKRSSVAAIVTGCACLTKQLSIAYLLPVGIYFILNDLGLFDKKIKPNWLMHTVSVGLVAILMGLPFILISHNDTSGLTQSFVQAAADKGIHESYWHKLVLYGQLLPQQMSLLPCLLFLSAVIFMPWRKHISLAPLTFSAVGGFALTCTSIWADLILDGRYTAPCLIMTAIYSAWFLGKLFTSQNRWQQAIALAMPILIAINYLFYNFIPYPLPLPVLPYQASNANNPIVFQDWGHDLVIKTIEERDRNLPVYLNILSNSDVFHPHIFQLLLKEKNNTTILPTSSRSWTIVGDKVQFNPTTALYYQWYLLETGSPGYCFYDKESEDNFNRLVDFVTHGGRYNLIATKALPDGNKLSLYRSISN